MIHAPTALVEAGKEARVENVTIAGFVERSGLLREQLTFRLRPSAGPVFSFGVPESVRVVSVRVDGRWADATLAHADGAEPILQVRTPVGTGLLALEVNWERAAPAWRLWNRVEGSVPKFPGQTPKIRRIWFLAPGLRRRTSRISNLCPDLPAALTLRASRRGSRRG